LLLTNYFVRDNEVVSALPFGANLFGFAVDIGTTKLAGYLVDLSTGMTNAKDGAMNPQIAYGEDVISRITYSREGEKAGKMLQTFLVEALNDMLNRLCQEAGIRNEQVVLASIVGNTAMHHLFAGLPVNQLALAPYVPSVGEAVAFRAGRIGLQMNTCCYIQPLPNFAGYVGVDHVTVILATQLWKSSHPTMIIDIGTNTEISLAVGGHIFTCSRTSGPAFGGAHIRNGMRASAGVIEAFQIIGGQKFTYTIGN
jgi:uncharacterized 2Fe-2S/4Fe-4S cluster protein (DUF4445 family)